MKLLLITEFFPTIGTDVFSGGVESRAYYTAMHLAKKHQVFVITQKRPKEASFEKNINLQITRVGKNVGSEVASIRSLLQRLQFVILSLFKALKMDIDLVEGSNYITFLPAFIVGVLKNIPKVAWYPDSLKGSWIQHFGLVLGSIGELAEHFYLHFNWDLYIAISHSTKQKLIDHGVKPAKILVVYCGINIKKTPLNRSKKNQLIVVSRLVSYKRVNWTIKVLKNLHDQKIYTKLIIIGKGPMLTNLKKLSTQLQLDNYCLFLQDLPQPSLYKLISQSKLFLHPSKEEGFGIVLLESAFLGTPYVAANISATRELTHNLQSGVLFTNDSFNSFSNQVISILRDSPRYGELKRSGQLKSRNYSYNLLTQKLSKHYVILGIKHSKSNN